MAGSFVSVFRSLWWPLDTEFETGVNNLNPFVGIDTVRYESKGVQARPAFDTDTDIVQQ